MRKHKAIIILLNKYDFFCSVNSNNQRIENKTRSTQCCNWCKIWYWYFQFCFLSKFSIFMITETVITSVVKVTFVKSSSVVIIITSLIFMFKQENKRCLKWLIQLLSILWCMKYDVWWLIHQRYHCQHWSAWVFIDGIKFWFQSFVLMLTYVDLWVTS